MAKPQVSAWNYLWAFLIANALFACVFLFAYGVSYLNYSGVREGHNILNDYIRQLEEMKNDSRCSSDLLYESSDVLDTAGARINLLETRFGKGDERVLEQKRLYNQLQVRHFEIVRKLKVECNKNFTTFLFFYSNGEEYQGASERAGYVLSALKNMHPDNVMVYSFDFDLNEEAANQLKARYNVTRVPITVVNEGEIITVIGISDVESFVK